MTRTQLEEVDILILGAGWTATFLIPLLRQRKFTFAATTSDGREVSGCPTIKYTFDPSDTNGGPAMAALPLARYVLVVFPLKGRGPSQALIQRYCTAHGACSAKPTPGADLKVVCFIQLGSTGIWQGDDPAQKPWLDRTSPYATASERAVAEDEFRAYGGCVLNLAGLWGGARDPRHWVHRVAASKEDVRKKTSLHMVHGVDVARLIVAMVNQSELGKWLEVGAGKRWMVTDGFVYDWWSLFAGWADTSEEGGGGDAQKEPIQQAQWVFELMQEEGVRALPRPMEALGRCYDSREVWSVLQIQPLKGGLGLK